MSRPKGPGGRSQRVDLGAVMAEALGAHRDGFLVEAIALYDRVLAHDRRHAAATHLKGTALLQCGRLDEARTLLAQAVRLKPQNAPAQSDLGVCLMRLGRSAEAVSVFDTAIRLMPNAAMAHANRAQALMALGRHVEALASFERAMSLGSGSADLALHYATALSQAGRHAEALVVVGRVLSAAPNHPTALKVRGDIAAVLGQSDDALAYYEKAIAAAPDFADARLARAGHVLTRGDGAGALAEFDTVLAEAPGAAVALAGRGAALLLLGRASEAVAALQAAVAHDPARAATQAHLAAALVGVARHADGLNAADKAIALDGEMAGAWFARGNALAGLGRLEEAIAGYDTAIALERDFVSALYEKAAVLRRLNRGPEATEVCNALLAIDPRHYEARWLAAFALLPAIAQSASDVETGRVALGSALDDLARHAGDARDAWRAVGRIKPFYLTYHEQDNRPLLERYGKLCHRLMAEWQAGSGIASPAPEPTAGRRLRVGIVSSDFNHHSIWTAITKGWVLGLDPARFALHLFHTGDLVDAQTVVARDRAAHFEFGRRSLEEWVAAVAARDLDAIIYPEIGVDPISLCLACLRLAPVQATTWGHPDTSGLPTIDAYLSADAFEPVGAEAHYSERLVKLPGLGVRCERLDVEARPFDRAAHGLSLEGPLLVSPGTPFKYAPQHDAVLVEIARRLPQASIVMFEPAFEHRGLFAQFRARLERVFAVGGLAMSDHVRVLTWLKPGDFYGLLTSAEAFLDTIGFSGFNTALQAIECGLPIVTREGRYLRGRLAGALYREMGLADAIAADEAAYVDLAVRLATEPSFRDTARARMVDARDKLFKDDRPIDALAAWLEATCATS